MEIKPFKTPLCELAFKYGTDKCPQVNHPYSEFYYELLKDKKINTVLEVGIGGEEYLGKIRRDGFHAELGGSLKMWRDFLGAKVYGIDYDPDCMFEDRDIKTFLAHGAKEDELKKVLSQIPEVDLFIDDGSHIPQHQVKTAKILLPLFKKDVIYIIEDVAHPEYVLEELKDYETYVPRMTRRVRGDRLVVVTNK
jgi:hypothetical protein